MSIQNKNKQEELKELEELVVARDQKIKLEEQYKNMLSQTDLDILDTLDFDGDDESSTA